MSTLSWGMQEPDRLAPLTREAVHLAQQEAHRLKATEVTLEHLLLGLAEQGEKGVLNVLKLLGVDVTAMRSQLEYLLREQAGKQEGRQRSSSLLLNDLKPGELRRGIVSHIANFGAFVDLGGIQGLIHNSQLSWSHVDHPSQVLQIGQEVEVRVLSVDKEKMKIALSFKRAMPNLRLQPLEEPDDNDAELTKSDKQLEADEVKKILLEEFPTATEELAVPDIRILHESFPLSREAQVSIHGAAWIAKRMHVLLIEPKHLLLSILHNQRIWHSFAFLLPPSKTSDSSTKGIIPMSTFSSGEREPDPPTPGIHEAIRLARKHAAAMGAQEVTPEHLLMGLVEQGDITVVRALDKAGIDAGAIRLRIEELFGAYSDSDLRGESLPMSPESQECLSWARSFARSKMYPLGPVPSVLLMIALMRTKQVQRFLIPILPTLKSILAPLLRDFWTIKPVEEMTHEASEMRIRMIHEALEALPPTPYPASLYDAPADQWSTIEQRYIPGQIIKGVVTRAHHFGVFVRIEDGVEGLLHLSEIPEEVFRRFEVELYQATSLERDLPPRNLSLLFYPGLELRVRILRIDAERHRLGLSLRDIPTGTASELSCPSCKRTVPADWKHCTFCGAELAKTCPQCGAPYPDVEDARFCFECGHPLK
jgi:predicted RNA-binding protein with RPS1 domain